MAFVEGQVVKISEHAVHHALVVVLFSVIGAAGGIIWHRWKMAKYGMRVTTRVCWLEKDGHGGRSVLVDKVIRGGSALDMLGGKDAAAALVRAAKRCSPKVDGLISFPCWNLQTAKHVLTRLSHGIEAMFAQGSVAKAMHDKDVTRGEFALAAFKRGNEVSVIMARIEDLRLFLAANVEDLIDGDVEELREMKRLASIFLSIPKECGINVVLYM